MRLSRKRPGRERERPESPAQKKRLSTIDWMRGIVMIFMVIDHASMAFDGGHAAVAKDSALYPDAMAHALHAAAFLTRWITHLCAPTFVFLAGTALALSVERRTAMGTDAWAIDKSILVRGAIIALLDPTLVSLGSGRLTFQVLLAIGVAMMCMAPLRRLPSWALLSLGLGWFAFGEIVTGWVWTPPGSSSIPAAFTVAVYSGRAMVVKYPVLPWLAIMTLGWVFGRHIVRFAAAKTRMAPVTPLWIGGAAGLAVFAVVRAAAGYGDMFLHRADGSWQQWLHVSKYPPSLSYAGLELGIMFLALATLMVFEERIGFRKNGPLLVFGQTAMFFYLVHRLVMEVPATYFGLRGFGGLSTTYIVTAVLVPFLYPLCRWYRRVKTSHPESFLKYI